MQWLFKVAHEQQTSKKQDQEVNSNGIVLHNNQRGNTRVEQQTSRLKCKAFSLFKLLRRKDIAKAYFYNTLHLKRPGSRRRNQNFVRSMNMKRENLSRGLIPSHKSDSSPHLGSTKILPISSDHSAVNGPKTEKKDKAKSDKTKTISKMKELLRWAGATKSEKREKFLGRKVFQFRNKTTLKAVPDDDQLSNDSPKISFRWEVESFSTISSSYSEISSRKNDQSGKAVNALSLSSTPRDASRAGNWITTDSEFVVLEL